MVVGREQFLQGGEQKFLQKCHGNLNYVEYNSAAATKFAFFP